MTEITARNGGLSEIRSNPVTMVTTLTHTWAENKMLETFVGVLEMNHCSFQDFGKSSCFLGHEWIIEPERGGELFRKLSEFPRGGHCEAAALVSCRETRLRISGSGVQRETR